MRYISSHWMVKKNVSHNRGTDNLFKNGQDL